MAVGPTVPWPRRGWYRFGTSFGVSRRWRNWARNSVGTAGGPLRSGVRTVEYGSDSSLRPHFCRRRMRITVGTTTVPLTTGKVWSTGTVQPLISCGWPGTNKEPSGDRRARSGTSFCKSAKVCSRWYDGSAYRGRWPLRRPFTNTGTDLAGNSGTTKSSSSPVPWGRRPVTSSGWAADLMPEMDNLRFGNGDFGRGLSLRTTAAAGTIRTVTTNKWITTSLCNKFHKVQDRTSRSGSYERVIDKPPL